MKKEVFIAVGGFFVVLLILVTFWFWLEQPPEMDVISAEPSPCQRERFEEKSYIVCRAHPSRDDIRLFLHNEQGEAYRRFAPLNEALAKGGEKLAFAMNAGMYHDDYRAVGLYIENGAKEQEVSTKDGPGNFHMKPNGIFYIEDGKAAILETHAYLAAKVTPLFATQSGPMLVIDNQIHPRFIANSPFLQYRNGVGVTPEGGVLFVISEGKVNFDEMARFFRDALGTPNALFLDGSISSLYAPSVGRADWWYPMGPIVGVVVKATDRAATITP